MKQSLFKKLISVILCFLFLAVYNISFPNSCVGAIASGQHKKIVKRESFAEEHSVLIKILKYLGIGAGAWATATVSYYGGRFVLDRINPERVAERNNRDVAKRRLTVIDSELFNFELGLDRGISPERVR